MNLANVRLLKRLYAEHKTDAQIGKEMGLTADQVQRTRLEYGLKRKRGAHPRFDPVAVQQMIAEGKSDAEIAQALGIKPKSVRDARSKHGIARTRRVIDADRVRELALTGHTDAEIASIMGWKPRAIGNVRRRLGIPARFSLDIDTVTRLHAAGKSDAKIAALLGVHVGTVGKYRRRAGITLPRHRVEPRPFKSPTSEALRLLAEGYSDRQIAALLGISRPVVRRWRKETA